MRDFCGCVQTGGSVSGSRISTKQIEGQENVATNLNEKKGKTEASVETRNELEIRTAVYNAVFRTSPVTRVRSASCLKYCEVARPDVNGNFL